MFLIFLSELQGKDLFGKYFLSRFFVLINSVIFYPTELTELICNKDSCSDQM